MALTVLAALVLLPPGGQEPVVDLLDRHCAGEVPIAVIDGARVYASCASEGPERVMKVSVENLAEPEWGPLREFSIGFCDPRVIGASAPSGWVAEVEGDERQSVTWSLPDALVAKLGVASGASATGFVVRLKPGWRRSRSDSARWGEWRTVVQATTHDCP